MRATGKCLRLLNVISVALVLALSLSIAATAESEQRRLTQEELVTIFSGATLFGRYMDGRPDWAEQTALTGQLYDAGEDWQEVGEWGTIGDWICYTYWNTGYQHCFDVYEQDGQLFFYTPGTDELVAVTYRIDRDELT